MTLLKLDSFEDLKKILSLKLPMSGEDIVNHADQEKWPEYLLQKLSENLDPDTEYTDDDFDVESNDSIGDDYGDYDLEEYDYPDVDDDEYNDY